MKYVAPIGSADPDANYTDPVEGTVPAAAVEQPMREIASVIASMGIVPSETDLTQLDQAIDMKVAAVQPDLSEFTTKEELARYTDELARYGEELVRYKNELTNYVNVSIAAEKNERISYVDTRISAEKYDLCEFYYFRNPTLRPGFLQAKGDLLSSASTKYPKAWAFLQTTEGKKLCITEAAWQSMSKATWATLADGTKVGWNGIGGVPFFVLNTSAGSLRLPDLRGMYAEAAGFDKLAVGDAQGDAIRNISGALYHAPSTSAAKAFAGALYGNELTSIEYATGHQKRDYAHVLFNASRVVPTANKNQPRAWGALACVYLGQPAA